MIHVWCLWKYSDDFSAPFTDMYFHIINCTLPNLFLSSQLRHNVFVVPENRNHLGFYFRDLGLPSNKPLHNILHLPESKRINVSSGYRVNNIADDKYPTASSEWLQISRQ
jgi:hypothetical protein